MSKLSAPLPPDTAAAGDAESPHARRIRALTVTGLSAIALFGGTVGLWATATEMSGAVIAPSQFVVDTSTKKIQHPTGGVVAELLVQEGSQVKAGDLLIRLDDTVLKANLQVISQQIEEAMARRARLVAERNGAEALVLPDGATATLTQRLAEEQRLFEIRRAARDGHKSQLAVRITQLEEEIAGLQAQEQARRRQMLLIEPELKGLRELYQRKLVPVVRINGLEREAAGIQGQIGQIGATIAQSRGKIAEIALQRAQIDEELRSDAMKELRELEAKINELAERRIAAEDQLRRTDIRAPNAGFVHQLAVHTVGGVITPAEPAMMIVPSHELLHLEGRVQPQDIDQLAPGQSASIRIQAYNQRTTPVLEGKLTRIAADVTRDPQAPQPYYTVRITVPADELQRLGDVKLVAGMQAEAFIRTEQRTPLSYLMKPLREQMARAFRER
jgi:HlyD family secretion protein